MNNRCQICGNSNGNITYDVRERQLNSGEVFHYLCCSRCGTLQLCEQIENIGSYYPTNYPAFRTREKRNGSQREYLIRKIILWSICYLPMPFMLQQKILESELKPFYSLLGTKLKKDSAILDVGCGSGNWLRSLREEGFSNLTGVDLFTAPPKDRKNWTFVKGEIYSKELRKYNCITMHHSFEHMAEPLKVMKRLAELLTDDGIAIVRIPVMDSLAWELYGTDWYQIDAPRHFFLYSAKAMRHLCKEAGLRVVKIRYDSEPEQFFASEMYQKTDLSLHQIERRLDKNHNRHIKMTKMANKNKKGDQAIFVIRKLRKAR